jgi:hypothetical protein
MIDIDNFTPLTALVGGGLIGLAAAILYAFNGRVLGASGITASAESKIPGAFKWAGFSSSF